MDVVLQGFGDAFTIANILYIAMGIAMGVFVGAIPGLNGPMAIALAVPLTFYMNPLVAVAFLVGINKGGTFGGSISAILLNTPGSPEAMATTFDGHPLSKQGKSGKALKMALYSSVLGDTFSDLVLILVAAPIAVVALKLGPVEICTVVLFALTMIAGLETSSLTKGLVAAAFGMLLSTVGLDPVTAMPRLTFGILELYDGIELMTIGIGMLALTEIIVQLERRFKEDSCNVPQSVLKMSDNPADQRVSWTEFRGTLKTCFRSAVIGTCVGTMPGLGATIASFLGYGAAKRSSKKPEEFGKGSLEGIAAAESANNAVVGSNLIPLFTLGIPGNVASALLIGAFVIHGITPGPLMFEENGRLIYGIYGGMLIANVLNLLIGNVGLRFFMKVVCLPQRVLFPVIIFICLCGSYMGRSSLFDVGLMIGFALLGYVMRKYDYSFITFLIGFVLGPMFELSFQQALVLSDNNPLIFLERPIAACMVLLTLIVVVRTALKARKQNNLLNKAGRDTAHMVS